MSDLAAEIMKAIGGNDETSTVKIWLDTGFPPLNRIVSGRYDGGMPVGRVIEIFKSRHENSVHQDNPFYFNC